MMAHQQKNETVSMQLNKINQKTEEVSMNCGSRQPRHRVSPMLGISLGLCLSLLLFPTWSFATVMGDLANQMQPGTWAELHSNGWSQSLIDAGGGKNILEYSDKAVWDSTRREFRFVGKGHNMNRKHIVYSDASNTWTDLGVLNWDNFGHAYQHNAIDPANGIFYYRKYNSKTVARYSMNSGSWISDTPPVPASYVNVANAVEYFPPTGNLIFVGVENNDKAGIFSWDGSSWTRVGAYNQYVIGIYHNVAVYNPVHKVMLFGGGNNNTRKLHKLDSALNVIPLGNAPIDIAIPSSVVTVDPASGDYLVFGKGNLFYKYNITTDTWTKLNSSSVPIFGGSQAVEGDVFGVVAAPVTSYGVTIFLQSNSDGNPKVYLYKHSASSSLPPSPDTTPPSTPTNLLPSVISSSQINLSWNASTDNVGVTGYNVFRNNTQRATPTSNSFSDTGLLPSTTYTYTVQAKDAAGNVSSQTSGVNATTQQSASSPPPPLPASGSDFQTRCQAPGIIKCFAFDDQAATDPFVYAPSGQTQKRGMVVSDIKASGSGSLRFTIPSNSGSDSSGSFWQNFSDDLSVQFGEGGDFYVQWRQRFSPEFLNTQYTGGGGWKQIIIGEGDRPGETVYSCTQLEIVTQNTYQRGFAQMYHSCGGKDGKYETIEVPIPPYDFGLQNAVDGCLYSKLPNAVPPCVGYKPNQWMTFQVHVKIGTWYKNDGNYHRDSTIELWIAEEGQPSRLVISVPDYDIANTENPAAKYGKLWLLPYHTGKSSAQSHPVGYVWYDDLIISTNKIADPTGSSSGGGDSTPPAAPQNLQLTVQ